ncbi:MAG: hypothetical protein K8J31_11145, partial [Anaerolineae bacterium]|nr:hypothetical protein [Anaerolineae bacterium]
PIAVVTLGSASNHATESQLTRLQQASGRFMIPDRDAAGWEAAKALFTALNSQLCLIHLSAAKDVTEFVVEQSGDLAALLTRHQAPGWWPSGVPDSWRTVLLNHTRPSTVLVIELIDEAMRAGLVRPDFTTIPQLVEASRTLGRSLS